MAWTKKMAFSLLLCLAGTGLFAQQLELGIAAYPGLAHNQAIDPGMNGWSLNLVYLQSFAENQAISGGLELGYTGWGSQSLLALGYRYGNRHLVDVEMLHGMALYRQGSQYVFGLGAHYSHRFFKGKNGLLLSAGIRYTVQPAYSEFSPIYHYIDLPIRLRWSRIFNN